MTEQQKQHAIRKFRTVKRRGIKSRVSELEKKNKDLFKLWAYEKSIDDKILRKGARENLIEIEKLQNAYDRAACEEVTEEMISSFLLEGKTEVY